MTDKMVGKTNYYTDPYFMTYGADGANFLSRRHNLYLDINTFFVEQMIGGWGAICFFGALLIQNEGFHILYESNIVMTYKEFILVGMSMTQNIIFCFWLFFIVLGILLFIVNKFWTQKTQEMMKGHYMFFMRPLTYFWRSLHKAIGNMTGESYGPISKTYKIFYLKQYVCADIELKGDYKTQLESIEWGNGEYIKYPSNAASNKLYAKIMVVIPHLLSLFGDHGVTRKITVFFKNPPKDGHLIIQTF